MKPGTRSDCNEQQNHTHCTVRIYGALPNDDDEPSTLSSVSRAPGEPPNWKPKHASPGTRHFGAPPRRMYTNRSSAESDADVVDVQHTTKRRRVDEDDEWGERVR